MKGGEWKAGKEKGGVRSAMWIPEGKERGKGNLSIPWQALGRGGKGYRQGRGFLTQVQMEPAKEKEVRRRGNTRWMN